MLSWVSGTTRAKVRSSRGSPRAWTNATRTPTRTVTTTRTSRRREPTRNASAPATDRPSSSRPAVHHSQTCSPSPRVRALTAQRRRPWGRYLGSSADGPRAAALDDRRRRRAAAGGGDQSRSGPAARRRRPRQRGGLRDAHRAALGPALADRLDRAICVDGVAVGHVGLSHIEHRHDTAWASYWVAETFRGRGLATRGLIALADHAFRDLGLFRARAGTPDRQRRVLPGRRPGRVHGRRHRALQAPLRRPALRRGDPRTAGDGPFRFAEWTRCPRSTVGWPRHE